MKLTGKRRGIDVPKQSRVKEIWLGAWQGLYSLVSIVTYLIAIVGMVISTYYVLIDFDPTRALMTGLLVVLMIYFNRINP